MGKGIFIGLGGAGLITTAHLKAKMLFDHYGNDADAMGEDCQFIFIDTDDNAINELNTLYSTRMGGGRDIITRDERENLGEVNPYATHWQVTHAGGKGRPDYEHFLSWVDPDAAERLRNQQLKKGASANRQQGRIAVWERWQLIEGKIKSALRILDKLESQKEGDMDTAYPVFYILSGTCGGTGSSSFLDVTYLVDRLYREKYQKRLGDPRIRAVLFMPYWYIDYYKTVRADSGLIENYQCNGFAFFDEVEAVLSDRWSGTGQKFSAAAARRINQDVSFPLFNLAFCIDSQTERGYSVSQEQMYRNTAELLYYWHLGSAQATMVSKRDNEDMANVSSGEAVPMFATIGYRALRFPEELMEEYFKRRFLFELFENGVLGAEYLDAVLDEHRRNEHIQQAFQKSIARYLFAQNQEENIPNMERERRARVENRLQFFDLGRFKREGKNAFDAGKIANPDFLSALVDDADSIARQIKEELKQDFEGAGGSTSLDSILRTMTGGYREATGKFGSLEDEIEDAIIRYGLKYAAAFAGRLDVLCEEQVQKPGTSSDLRDKQIARSRRLKELEGEIAAAVKSCQETSSSKREPAIWELYNKLREQIELRAEVVVIEQQIEVLNKLSFSEQGILDDYERGIGELITQVQQLLSGSDDQNLSLRNAYTIHLPSRFIATREDVTTTYLPSVLQFVEQGNWARGHLFDILYQKLVEQDHSPGGGDKPRRYGSDFGYAATKRGLHAILWDMLTQSAYSGYENGYELDGHTNFFRKAFARRPPEKSAVEILNELQRIARNYIEIRSREEGEVRRQRDMSLLDRFNSIESDEERKWIANQFSEVGTQTFCPMDSTEGTIYSVYAGPQEALAVALGYKQGETHQFVKEDSKNRLVRIKMLTRQTLRQYPHYRDLRATYYNVREARMKDHVLFSPHIHRVFNKVGAALGLSQVTLDTADQRMRLYATLLLYREACEKARTDTPWLIEQLLDLNPAFRGQEKRQASPLLIEKLQNEQRIARICARLEKTVDGRLILLEKNYRTAAYNAINFKAIFLEMERDVTLFATLSEFDNYFRSNASSDWIPLIVAARDSLDAKIAAGLENADVKAFYNELSNILVKLSDELSERLRANTPQIIVGTGGGNSGDVLPV
jgi:hypothetical protein